MEVQKESGSIAAYFLSYPHQMRGAGQRNSADVLFPGIKKLSLYRMLSGPEGQPAEVRKKSPPQNFEPRTVQPAPFRYSDRSLLAHITFLLFP